MSVELGGHIVVTGTNRGIGLELVRQLAEKTGVEAHIYACCREPEGTTAQALRELTLKHPGKITLIKLDLADEDSISAAVQTVGQRIGPDGLNLLINNAAVNKPDGMASLQNVRKSDMMDVFEVNVTGPFLLTKMFLPLLQRAVSRSKDKGDEMSCRRSAVINVSSLAGSIEKCPENFHFAHIYPYRTSKAALNMLTRCQAEDLSSQNILVMCIHPGWVRTDMGGEEAPLSSEDSVVGMLRVMSSLSRKHTGTLLDWEGNTIAW
ncbi:C-factor [Austrofundulus limnaeus]|uniref:C-factor n=1 Tax=Austrofundulus limnaeus TaxID=52670 RepID=A0A2I4BDA0_AUSLI|nr:PREDICTED: C-factor-like [Austrofundulus limnaeus]